MVEPEKNPLDDQAYLQSSPQKRKSGSRYIQESQDNEQIAKYEMNH